MAAPSPPYAGPRADVGMTGAPEAALADCPCRHALDGLPLPFVLP